MSTLLIQDLSTHLGESVSLAGWLSNVRSSGKLIFIQFRDGTGEIQVVVVKKAVPKDSWTVASTASLESSLVVTGLVKSDPRSPTGYELEANSITLIQLASLDYPIGKKAHGPAFLLDHRHLWLRSPKQVAILRIRSHLSQAIRQFYQQAQFTEVVTPIFTPTACEGTTTLFQVDYFGQPAYLSQSGQLYLEAMLPALNRVYDFQPVFRAEKSKTRRHLIEFWMSNAEAAFTDHEANCRFQERLIEFVVHSVIKACPKEFALLKRNLDHLGRIKTPFPKLTYIDAVKRLKSKGLFIAENADLGAEAETLLSEDFTSPFFIEYYPAKAKAFYMKRLESDPSKAKCADLLAPEGHGEIIGGSERETDYQTLLTSLKDHNLPVEAFEWYLDGRKYGSVPHSGFGIGLERLTKWICNLPHIRETVPFPRLLNRLTP